MRTHTVKSCKIYCAYLTNKVFQTSLAFVEDMNNIHLNLHDVIAN